MHYGLIFVYFFCLAARKFVLLLPEGKTMIIYLNPSRGEPLELQFII